MIDIFWLVIIVSIISFVIAFLIWLFKPCDAWDHLDIPLHTPPLGYIEYGGVIKPYFDYKTYFDYERRIAENRSVKMIPAIDKLQKTLIDIARGYDMSISIRDYYTRSIKIHTGAYRPAVSITDGFGGRTYFSDIKPDDVKLVRLLCDNIEYIIDSFVDKRAKRDKEIEERKLEAQKREEESKHNKTRVEEISKCCIQKMEKLGY